MFKKGQPQTKEVQKNKIQIVDQQNEPFLKVLQKKIRNINKRLTEISELQNKDNLKPEQVEKINRKTTIIEERTKVEETLALFRETYAENIAFYRNNQLKHLEALARALSIYHQGGKIEEQEKLITLWRVLQQSDKTYSSLNQAISTLSSALKDFANDKPFQKILLTYAEKNGDAKTHMIEINHEKIVSGILEEKKEAKIESALDKKEVKALAPEKKETKAAALEKKEVKVESAPEKKEVKVSAPEKQEVKVVQSAPKKKEVFVPIPEPQPVVIAQPVTIIEIQPKTEPVKKIEQPVIVEHPKTVESPPLPVVIQEVSVPQPIKESKQLPKEGERKNNNYNRGRQNKTQGGYREKKDYGIQPRERKYKPKYEEKKPEFKAKEEKDSSSSDSSPEARDFRREEIKKLQEQGFIVIGKPKPKAKDSQELHESHYKQHGNKGNHPHGSKN